MSLPCLAKSSARTLRTSATIGSSMRLLTLHLLELARCTDDRRLVTRIPAHLLDAGRRNRIREMPHVPRHQIIYSVQGRDGGMSAIGGGLGWKGCVATGTRPTRWHRRRPRSRACQTWVSFPARRPQSTSRVIDHHDVDPSGCRPAPVRLPGAHPLHPAGRRPTRPRLVATACPGGWRAAAACCAPVPSPALPRPATWLPARPARIQDCRDPSRRRPHPPHTLVAQGVVQHARQPSIHAPGRTSVAGPATLRCRSMAGGCRRKGYAVRHATCIRYADRCPLTTDRRHACTGCAPSRSPASTAC